MSRQGKVIWEAHHTRHDAIGDLALGTAFLYYILRSSPTNKFVFMARSHEDGSIVFQEDLPFGLHYLFLSLRLFANERLAAYGDPGATIWILDATSGKIVSSVDCGYSSSRTFSTRDARLWIVPRDTYGQSLMVGFEIIIDAEAKIYDKKELKLDFIAGSKILSMAFDGDRQLCFHIIRHNERRQVAQLSVAPLTTQEVVQQDGARSLKLKESSLAEITLPSRHPRMGSTRRRLHLSRSDYTSAHVKAVCPTGGDYLVFHDPVEQLLFLVDFWPSW